MVVALYRRAGSLPLQLTRPSGSAVILFLCKKNLLVTGSYATVCYARSEFDDLLIIALLQGGRYGSTGNYQKNTIKVKTMSIFEKTKHCTHRISCRLKLSLMVCTVAILATVISVPLISA
jgi:hypothetical protein